MTKQHTEPNHSPLRETPDGGLVLDERLTPADAASLARLLAFKKKRTVNRLLSISARQAGKTRTKQVGKPVTA